MRHVSRLLKVGVSFGLCAYLVYIVDIQKTLVVLRTSRYAYLILAVAIYLASFVVTALRWQLVLRVQQVQLPFRQLLSFYLIGFFFNNFLPTSIGGDVARIYHSARASGRRAECVTAVLIERIIGFLAILCLAILGLLWVADRLQNPVLMQAAVAVFCLLAGALLLLTRRRGLALLEKLTGRITWKGIAGRCRKVFNALRLYRNRWGALAAVFILSLVFQGMMVITADCISRAIDLGVGGWDFLVCVSVVAILGMLPSINGLGIREGGYVYLFTQLGKADGSPVDTAAAFSFTILVLGVTILISLVGGVLFISGRGVTGRDTVTEILSDTTKDY